MKKCGRLNTKQESQQMFLGADTLLQWEGRVTWGPGINRVVELQLRLNAHSRQLSYDMIRACLRGKWGANILEENIWVHEPEHFEPPDSSEPSENAEVSHLFLLRASQPTSLAWRYCRILSPQNIMCPLQDLPLPSVVTTRHIIRLGHSIIQPGRCWCY